MDDQPLSSPQDHVQEGGGSSQSQPSDRRADALSVGLSEVRSAVEGVTGIPDAMRAEPSAATLKPCTMAVGCDETGVCFAAAHGEPERCPRLDEGWWPL